MDYDDRVWLHHGDCVEWLRGLPDASIDAIVTDPPYGIGFMGKDWDDLPGVEFAEEAVRVLKPGGHIVAFSSTRTVHRLMVALEDGGFNIRDTLHWCYWSGFPKSFDISKSIDKAAGAIPATPDAVRWSGWGTALKPAIEPAVLARKPSGATAANIVKWGTGGLHIDACRFAAGAPEWLGPNGPTATGRWPANLVYTPKASRQERERGTDDLVAITGAEMTGRQEGSAGLNSPRAGAGRTARDVRNHHPTVKPVRLMRWLVRLVTPPGGVVCDPFLGSGSTAVAALLEGFNFAGAERAADYMEIARARARHAFDNPDAWKDTIPGSGKRQGPTYEETA